MHEVEHKLCTDVRMQAHVLRTRGDITAGIVTPSLWMSYGPYTSHMPGYKQAAHAHECCKIVIELCYAIGQNIVLRNFCIFLNGNLCMEVLITLTHCGPVTQICVFCIFALQLWKTDDTKLPFNTRLVFMHLITQYMEPTKNGPPGRI
jgi:hypothetical protein